MRYLNFICLIAVFLTAACTDDLELRKASLSDYDDFDTIDVVKDHNMYILYGMSHTDIDLESFTQTSSTALFVKHDANNREVAYKIFKIKE